MSDRINVMTPDEWLAIATKNEAPTTAARRAGIPPSTITRQIASGKLTAEVVIKIARLYGAPILDSLVACGHITQEEADLKDRLGVEESLYEATDQQLLQELLRRVDSEGALAHPTLIEPMDNVVQFPGTPTEGMTDAEVAALMRSQPQRNAALNPGYAPEDEYDQ